MPHGSRIALLLALALTGCQSADKRGQQLLPLKPANLPAADTTKPKEPTAKANPTGRSENVSPVVTNDKFQRQPIAVSGTPQPGVAPPLGVPTLPTTGVPGPAMAEPTPPGAPGLGGTPLPPMADAGAGDLKVPSLTGPK
jgi:hypothetical protein